MNDWNPKKVSLRSHRPPRPAIEPMPGSSMSPSALPSRSKSLSCELAFFSYCARIFHPTIAVPCRMASVAGIISFQLARVGIGRVDHEQVEVRCVFIGGDVDLSPENLAVVMKVLAAGEFDRRCTCLQVLRKSSFLPAEPS